MHEVQQDKDEKSKAIIDTISTEIKREISILFYIFLYSEKQKLHKHNQIKRKKP